MYYLVFHVRLLSFVKVHLNEPRAVQFYANPLADNFRRIAQVFKDGIVHSSQRPAEIQYTVNYYVKCTTVSLKPQA